MRNKETHPPLPRVAYKISEAATLLGVSPLTIRRLITRGAIVPVRILRHLLIPADQLVNLLKP